MDLAMKVAKTAKVFWSGRSQSVRLPKEFRFKSDEVRIRRHGNAVILESPADDWAWLDKIAQKLDRDFIEAVNEKLEQPQRCTSTRVNLGESPACISKTGKNKTKKP
jgi:antitoxin VapB